jgi:hypothetical protein
MDLFTSATGIQDSQLSCVWPEEPPLFHVPNLRHDNRIEMDFYFAGSFEDVYMRGNMVVEVDYDLVAFSPENRRHCQSIIA